MDLLSEGSSEPRILAARHLSGKTLPETNNAVNTTLLCYDYSLQPDVGSYVAALGKYTWVVWSCGALVLAIICLLYAVTLRSARQHWRLCITNIAVLMAVYPIVAAASLVAIIVPRAGVLCEAVAQEAVMLALYHFFCMILAECGGPDKLVRMSDETTRWQTRVLPCCCWPCCVLPRPQIQVRNLTWLRYTILQMPIIQALIYFVILVLWAEDVMLYLKSLMFIQPLIAFSILFGMWGIIMCIRTVETLGIKARPRFLAVQLVLLIVKLQFGMVKTITGFFELPCIMSLHPAVFVNLIQNCVMMLEMLLLCLWAWRLYSLPPGKVIERVQHAVVAVVDDTFNGFDEKAIKEGVENKSFKFKIDM
ncbi:organic solute transporter alpha-like protein [Amyelois transitella]|uniref:organic solute transporter alpha-like protein n=1 Tax=Amyelois transitella TaxID=680683 RepID=UPI00298FC58C|nr:organic solute transporter alpha-like protein [Amyelois transitella]